MPYASDAGNFSIAIAGDCMLTRRLSVFEEPAFLARFAEAAGQQQRALDPFPAAAQHDIRHGLRRRADQGKIYFVGHFLECRVALQTKDFGRLRIDRDNLALILIGE